jgi:organic hydroperoxide reductase OsmC/OhrA
MSVHSRYPECILYRAQTRWDGKTGGTAISSDNREIVFDTPETYGGNGLGICPDEMFVSSILACLQNTFLDFQRRFELELVSFELKGIAKSVFDKEGYKITELKIEGSIVVSKDELDIGERCMELMKKYCHLTRTIKQCLPIEYDISLSEI